MMGHTDCVISAVGRNSLHRQWLDGEPHFDLHLIVYDDSADLFRGDTEHLCQLKGYKLKVVYRYLELHPELMGRYDYFFIPDDDLQMNAAAINALFEAMRRYGLRVAQPALRMSYFSWKHTLRDRYCRLRYTNFVEMMMPCFSREALEKVLFTFDENETGWGTEAHWPRLLHAGPKDMAIVDEIGVVHARPIQPGRPLHRQEQEAYFRKYGLTDRVEEYSTLPADGAQNFPCSRERYGQFKAMFSHWLEVERMATASVGEDGHFGYAHFLFLLARITESQRLADAALDILGRAQDWLGNIKDDMSFGHGIAGCCWLVEFLARNGFIDCAPQDVLEEVNLHVERYLREHEDGLSFTELAGIGRYYLTKAARSGTAEHRRDCEHVAELLERKTDGEEDEADIETVADALELLQKCGRTDRTRLRRLEKRVGTCTCTPLEHAHRMFRLYGLTGDEYFKVCVREELEHLPPQLLDLGGALALAEMLSFDSNGLIS